MKHKFTEAGIISNVLPTILSTDFLISNWFVATDCKSTTVKQRVFKKFISAVSISFLFLLAMMPRDEQAQTVGDYRSVASGNWSSSGIWQRYNGVIAGWVGTSVSPSPMDETITIQNEHIVTLNFSITDDQIVIPLCCLHNSHNYRFLNYSHEKILIDL